MSATLEVPATATQDRSVLATRRLCEALGLEVLKPKDLKNLGTALAEAAVIEAEANTDFADRIRFIFRSISETKTVGSTRTPQKSRPAKAKLVPVGYVDPSLFGPNKPIDPYAVQQAYGNHQLQAALENFPATTLKKSVAIVEERNPGTHPINRSQKQALIDYIVRYVVGE